MGLSFSGPTAPQPRRPHLFAWPPRLALAALLAGLLVTLATAAYYLTTYPPIVTYLLQPFSLFLIPGALLEALGKTEYTFSNRGAVAFSFALYTLLFSYLLRPRLRLRPR